MVNLRPRGDHRVGLTMFIDSLQSVANHRPKGAHQGTTCGSTLTIHINLIVSGQSQAQKRSSEGIAWLGINNTHQSHSQWPISGPHQEATRDSTLKNTYQSHGQWPITGPKALIRRQRVARH